MLAFAPRGESGIMNWKERRPSGSVRMDCRRRMGKKRETLGGWYGFRCQRQVDTEFQTQKVEWTHGLDGRMQRVAGEENVLVLVAAQGQCQHVCSPEVHRLRSTSSRI